MFAGFGEEVKVVFQELNGRFGDHDMDLSLNSVQGDWIVGGIWREDGDCVARREGINGGFVGVWVAGGCVGREGGKGGI